MELFAVKRYAAETTKTTNEDEQKILNKLLKKVEKRKRKQAAAAADLEAIKNQQNIAANDEEVSAKKQNKTLEAATNEEDSNVLLDSDPITADANEVAEDDDAGAASYEVLGEDVDFKKQQRVEMILPAWLAHPTLISTSLVAAGSEEQDTAETAAHIKNLQYLSTHTQNALKELNVKRLFPVQTAVVPWILEAHNKPAPYRPRDICVSAPTGSGKTLAFAIPIVQLLANRVQCKIRALVVLPVGELALQVFKVFKKLCDKTVLNVVLLSKQTVLQAEQEKLLECYKDEYYSKADIVVTTPGRLVEHLHATKGFCLKSLQFLVIDEADRIMDQIFQNWLYHLDEHVRLTSDQLLAGRSAPLCLNELQRSAHTQPHKLLFSATLSQDPEKLQNLKLFHPKLFTSVGTNLQELHAKFANAADAANATTARGDFVGKYTTPAELMEKYCLTENRLKPLTLYALIKENNWRKFLCFTNSADAASRLNFVLKQLFKNTLEISELSASLNAQTRAQTLSHFAQNKIQGLICSDTLARGIDLPDVDIVISYEVPRHVTTYIHRIGRTARAGKHGTAITLLHEIELRNFNQKLFAVGKLLNEEITVPLNTEADNAQQYMLALKALREHIERTKRTKVLVKERLKNKAIFNKDPTKMTLMEKLQVQISEKVHDRITKDDEILASQQVPRKFRKKIKNKKKLSKEIK